MLPLLICIVAFVGVSALVGGVAFLFRDDTANSVEDRLALLTSSHSAKQAKDALLRDSVLAHPLANGQSLAEVFMSQFGNASLLFEQADTSLTPQRFLTISAVFGLASAAAAVACGLHAAAVPAIGVSVALLPLLWITTRRKRRFAKFAKQLPDALELIARALRAGHSLAAGMHLVSEEMTAPVGKEFSRVFEEQNLGIPLEDALESLTKRIPNLDLRFFATAVVLQRQTGGDLAEILDKIGELVRERFKIFGQVQALTGEGRLSGVVLLALPPVLFVVVYKLNADYVMPLFTDPMGKKMLIGGLIMQLLGAITIRKIVNIRV